MKSSFFFLFFIFLFSFSLVTADIPKVILGDDNVIVNFLNQSQANHTFNYNQTVAGSNLTFNYNQTQVINTTFNYNQTSSANSTWHYNQTNLFNTTQIEQSGGGINILESWLTTFWNKILGTKTTDVLTEGTTNLYDNQSFNKTYTDGLYSGSGGKGTSSDYLFNDSNDIFFNDTFQNETLDLRYVNVDGDTMTGDLSLGDNNITDVLRLVFNVTGCDESSIQGTICWNTDDYTLNIVSGLGNVLQVGQEITLIAINNETVPLLNGQIVSLVGSQGDRGLVKLADASNPLLTSRLAVVTLDSCNLNAECAVTTFGRVRDLNTSAWASGTLLYLSDDGSGNLTSTVPEFPNYRILIAAVIRSHETDGIILVGPRLDYTDGVTISSLGVINNLTLGGWINGVNISNVSEGPHTTGGDDYLDNIADQMFFNDTLNNITIRNLSLNQTEADILYANIEWGYNQSVNHTFNYNQTGATNTTFNYNQTFNETFNYNQSIGINVTFNYNQTQEINTTFNYNQTSSANSTWHYNQTQSLFFYNMTDDFNLTQMERTADGINILESWLTSFINIWFGTKDTDDLTEGTTNLYDNQSFNQTLTDTRYIRNDSEGWTLNITKLFAETFYTLVDNVKWNMYSDSGDLVLNVTNGGGDFQIEQENSKIKLFNSPSDANDYKILQIFSKEASDVSEFVITKAGEAHTSYNVRSFSLPGNSTDTPTPFNCTTYASFIDCRTDLTGPDFYVRDDVEIFGSIYIGNGSINSTDEGNLSAVYFIGNGSQLTDITEAQIIDLVHTVDTNASTECSGDEVLLGNTSCLTISSFGGDNASWNKSYADTLYADIEWGYNQTNLFNTTQIEQSGGGINILESWLTTFWNKILGTKTTDDLTEGTTNLYDNQSFNKTYTDGLYTYTAGNQLSLVGNEFNLLDNLTLNQLNVSEHFRINEENITCLNGACSWFSNATDSCIYWPSGGKDCGT